MTTDDRPLTKWLRAQYGPGRRWPTLRQFSIACGNERMVPRLETQGTGDVSSLRAVSRATGEPLVNLMLLAGLVTVEEMSPRRSERLTGEEQQVLQGFRELNPEGREAVVRLLRVLLETAPSLRRE